MRRRWRIGRDWNWRPGRIAIGYSEAKKAFTAKGQCSWPGTTKCPVAHRLLARCDAVLRLPGDSKGADNDVRLARERGLPVYHRIEDVPGCR